MTSADLSQRRSFVSSLTFFFACLTVSASNILQYPVKPENIRFAAEGHVEGALRSRFERGAVDSCEVRILKRPRRSTSDADTDGTFCYVFRC